MYKLVIQWVGRGLPLQRHDRSRYACNKYDVYATDGASVLRVSSGSMKTSDIDMLDKVMNVIMSGLSKPWKGKVLNTENK